MRIHRLNVFIAALCGAIAWSCQTTSEKKISTFSESTASLYDTTLRPFYHGVASGDPLTDRVIIWTRVTPADSVGSIEVTWEMSEDEDFTKIVQQGKINTGPERDFTVKHDVTGLTPGLYYYYRFKALGSTSMTGRTKTLASGRMDSLTLAVVSCSNWEFGYFNAYDRIAEKEVDAVLHLGDYIYEYQVGGYGDSAVNRKHLPAYEIVSLSDYRTRYAQYHLDQGLRHMRQRHPMITIWDDHEVANNVYVGGAENHQPDEGDFNARKEAARKAYYEWIPIREGSSHYRSFSFGGLADVIMLDERLEGRTKQAENIQDASVTSSDQHMLGETQLSWFTDKLSSSGATWKIIGNQVIFSDLDQSANDPGYPRNLDSWDGYLFEKNKIASTIRDKKVSNVIFLSGDTHASWAFEIAVDYSKTYNPKSGKGSLGIELGTTSVSSGNTNEYISNEQTIEMEKGYVAKNPHLKFTNHRDHGYLLLSLKPQQAVAKWYYINTLKQIDSGETLGKQFIVAAGTNRLQ